MTNRFDIIDTALDGLKVLERKPIGDTRGYLERMFCVKEYGDLFAQKQIMQINHTLTEKAGTIRGMHFQIPPHSEIKIVSCLRGKVLDIAIDLRKGSPTFLQSHAEILSESNYRTLCIPEGFAHGFQTLTDNCELLYFHSAMYNGAAENGLNPLDDRLKIKWPLAVSEISDRDKNHPMINDNFKGLSQ